MFQFCQFQNNRKLFTDRQTDKQKDRQTNQIIEAPLWSLIRIWNVCCYSHYHTFPYIYEFGQIKGFQKISTDRPTNRPTDQGTDRQCQLLSCPGQLKITREKILNKQCLPVVENALKHVCQTFCSTLGSFALSNNSVKYFLRFYFLNTMLSRNYHQLVKTCQAHGSGQVGLDLDLLDELCSQAPTWHHV